MGGGWGGMESTCLYSLLWVEPLAIESQTSHNVALGTFVPYSCAVLCMYTSKAQKHHKKMARTRVDQYGATRNEKKWDHKYWCRCN